MGRRQLADRPVGRRNTFQLLQFLEPTLLNAGKIAPARAHQIVAATAVWPLSTHVLPTRGASNSRKLHHWGEQKSRWAPRRFGVSWRGGGRRSIAPSNEPRIRPFTAWEQCGTQATWPEKHCVVRMPDTTAHLHLPRGEGGVMDRLADGPTILGRNGRGRSAAVACAIRLLPVIVSGLTCWAISTHPAGADIEHANRAGFHSGAGAHFHFQDPDLAALRDYAQRAGLEQPEPASARDGKRPHHHFDDPHLAALHDYGQQVARDDSDPAEMPRLRVAEADSAFDALRQFLRRGEQPDSAPKSNPAPRA